MRTRVLVVAQSTGLRAALAQAFLPVGYGVEVASSEKAARQLLKREQFDAAVVAPGAPAPREMTFLRELEDAVGKLVILADDKKANERFAASFPEALVCLAQPLQPQKFVPFVGAPAKGANGGERISTRTMVAFESCTLDFAGHIFLDAEGREVALTRGEFALLVAFVESPGRVLSRTDLRRAVTGGRADAYDRSIDMLVARLRRKIEAAGKKVRFIVTVPGAGYKFVARVRTLDPEAAAHSSTRYLPAAHAAAPDPQALERRQLTVVACQILGFAALAAELDPEDLQRTISGVYAACTEVVARYGGTTERAIGDGVLAYFGHPKATEHDAESAVRAALDLVRMVGSIEAAPIGRFRARAGVATGLMLIGGMGTVPAIGEAANLAQHLRQAAPAGAVIVGASTRTLLGRLFAYREVEPVMVEDCGKPVPAFQVTEAATEMNRFDALRRDGMLPLVGRTAEIERLMQHWAGVRRGAGQVVLLSGERRYRQIAACNGTAENAAARASRSHAVFRLAPSQRGADDRVARYRAKGGRPHRRRSRGAETSQA